MLRWRFLAFAVICASFVCSPAFAQQPQDSAPADSSAEAQADQAQVQGPTADSPEAVAPLGAPGSRFFVTLETPISTKQDKAGKAFLARTVNPLTTEDGEILPPGTAVRGHVVKVHPAEVMDKARLWLAFDEIHTRRGWAPLAAGLIDMPDVQKLRVLFDHEGAIEMAPARRNDEVLAALAAAMSGASPGVANKSAKDAASGAAESAAEAFMATSGMGQELTLAPNMRMQLALARPIRLRHA